MIKPKRTNPAMIAPKIEVGTMKRLPNAEVVVLSQLKNELKLHNEPDESPVGYKTS